MDSGMKPKKSSVYSLLDSYNELKFSFRLLSNTDNLEPIDVRTHPFQMTSQPPEVTLGSISSTLFIGMDLVLIPITLAVDMVYDREVRNEK